MRDGVQMLGRRTPACNFATLPTQTQFRINQLRRRTMAEGKRRPKEVVLPLAEVTTEPEQQPPLQASSVHGSVQEQPSGFAAVEGVPVVRATMRPFAYVGIPIDDEEALRSPSNPPTSYASQGEMAGAGRVHGDVSLGVGRDFAGAQEAARASARRDNAAFFEKKGFTEAQARSRVEADLRAFEVARINAKRRDAEGLYMRPHPGNHFEPEGGFLGEKGWAYGAGSGGEVGDSSRKEGKGGKGSGQEEQINPAGGYQCADYVPAEYDIPEYKSVYDTPPEK